MRDRRYIGFCNPAIFAIEFHFGFEVAWSSLWQRFQRYLLEYRQLGFSLDISRIKFPDDLFEKMRPQIEHAFAAMRELGAGAIANPTDFSSRGTRSPSPALEATWTNMPERMAGSRASPCLIGLVDAR